MLRHTTPAVVRTAGGRQSLPAAAVSSRRLHQQLPLQRQRVRARDAATAAPAIAAPAPAITLTDNALQHLKKLRDEHKNSSELLLRVGVKQGGCSGMSYIMDFTESINEDDHVMTYAEDEGKPFRLVIDPKSLLYLFGLQMDYSSALIGGGFKFSNPNSNETCGCGKSFNV